MFWESRKIFSPHPSCLLFLEASFGSVWSIISHIRVHFTKTDLGGKAESMAFRFINSSPFTDSIHLFLPFESFLHSPYTVTIKTNTAFLRFPVTNLLHCGVLVWHVFALITDSGTFSIFQYSYLPFQTSCIWTYKFLIWPWLKIFLRTQVEFGRLLAFPFLSMNKDNVVGNLAI